MYIVYVCQKAGGARCLDILGVLVGAHRLGVLQLALEGVDILVCMCIYIYIYIYIVCYILYNYMYYVYIYIYVYTYYIYVYMYICRERERERCLSLHPIRIARLQITRFVRGPIRHATLISVGSCTYPSRLPMGWAQKDGNHVSETVRMMRKTPDSTGKAAIFHECAARSSLSNKQEMCCAPKAS